VASTVPAGTGVPAHLVAHGVCPIGLQATRRGLTACVFNSPASCLWLVRALAVEVHEEWIEDTRYLNMELLREPKKELLKIEPAA